MLPYHLGSITIATLSDSHRVPEHLRFGGNLHHMDTYLKGKHNLPHQTQGVVLPNQLYELYGFLAPAREVGSQTDR